MGAESFETIAKGRTAKEAFDTAKAEARHWHGHGGYTGTIAEKPGFRSITPPRGVDLKDRVARRVWIDSLYSERNHWLNNKWGDCACIHLGGEEYLFFGWASS
jgi:hypothetical protein